MHLLTPARQAIPADGRVDASARSARLVEVAEHLFIEHGFHATCMDAVAKQAGVSKKTLYQVFGSKDGLFAAVVRRHDVRLVVDDLPSEPQAALNLVLLRLARLILHPRRIAIHRLVAIEGARSKRLAQTFYQNGPQIGLAVIERQLNELTAAGVCRLNDPAEAARMLVGMTIGDIHAKLLFGVVSKVNQSMLEQRIQRSVEIFLSGTRPSSIKTQEMQGGRMPDAVAAAGIPTTPPI